MFNHLIWHFSRNWISFYDYCIAYESIFVYKISSFFQFLLRSSFTVIEHWTWCLFSLYHLMQSNCSMLMLCGNLKHPPIFQLSVKENIIIIIQYIFFVYFFLISIQRFQLREYRSYVNGMQMNKRSQKYQKLIVSMKQLFPASYSNKTKIYCIDKMWRNQ